MKPLLYAEAPPSAALARHVLSHWWFEARLAPGESLEHHVWPDGCVSLLVALRDGARTALVTGPTVEARRMPVVGGMRARGVRLWPDAAAAVLGVSPGPLRDGRDARCDAHRTARRRRGVEPPAARAAVPARRGLTPKEFARTHRVRRSTAATVLAATAKN